MKDVLLYKWYYALPPLMALLIYSTAGPIVPEQSLWTTICLGVLVSYAVVATFFEPKNKLVVVVFVFLLVQIIYYLNGEEYVRSSLVSGLSSSGQIKAIIMNFIPFIIAFFLSWKGLLKKESMMLYTFVYILFLIPKYFYAREQQLMLFYWADETTINTGYNFAEALVFLPLISKRKYLLIVLLSIIIFFCMLSGKRGSIVLAAIFLILFLPRWLKTNRNNTILILIGIIAVAIIGFNYFSNDSFLIDRLEITSQGYSSGRDSIYEDIWNYCMVHHFSIKTLLLGFGFNSSLKMSINMAHNDWLELLSCCGLLGIIIYFLFFYQIYNSYRQYKSDKDQKFCLLLLLLLWFTKTFFSMAYTGLWYMPLMLGFLIGSEEYYKKQNKKCHIKV